MSKESIENRNEAYRTLEGRELKIKLMMDLLSDNPQGLTDKEMAAKLKIELSSVCSTRNALVDQDKVTSNGSKLNVITDKMNTTWTLKS